MFSFGNEQELESLRAKSNSLEEALQRVSQEFSDCQESNKQLEKVADIIFSQPTKYKELRMVFMLSFLNVGMRFIIGVSVWQQLNDIREQEQQKHQKVLYSISLNLSSSP